MDILVLKSCFDVVRPNIRPNLWNKLPNIRIRPNLKSKDSAKVRFRPNWIFKVRQTFEFGRTSFSPVWCTTRARVTKTSFVKILHFCPKTYNLKEKFIFSISNNNKRIRETWILIGSLLYYKTFILNSFDKFLK